MLTFFKLAAFHFASHISTAIVLNRAPILTRTPTPFELAYYSYQARIRRALHNPFPYDFYFKQGTLIETRFNLEERKRERLAFGPAFLPKEDQLAQQEGEGEILMPRTHPSDTSGDVKSLDRRGQRVGEWKNVWRFPQGDVEKGLFLHQAAKKIFMLNVVTKWNWVVGKAPIGVYKPPQSPPTEGAQQTPRYRIVFFYKAHIMADFAWLTKEEIETRVDQHYWDGIKDILSDH
ncbi:50S ribosomal subunit L30 [Pholiota molesta]|nr:50S ribosomal subunit L30 [Pholiota molesta]